MAQIVLERSAIADFLDELPSLLLQYKQLEYAQEERALDREERKATVTQGILLKEYYDKKAEIKTTEAIYDQYDNLKPSDMSQGGADIISIVDEQNNINMQAVTQNLNTLSTYQSELETGLSNLRGQAQILKEMQMDFAGTEGVLQQHEYEEFREHALKAMEEGGLGWETTAGADVEFYKKDPTTRQLEAMKVTEHMQKEARTGAEGSYAILQAIYTPGEGEDTDDLVDKLTYEVGGEDVEPSEEVIAAIQSMAGQNISYDDFLANLNAYPASGGGDQIRAELINNPNTAQLFNNLTSEADLIRTLDNELAGINESTQATDVENFVSSISGIGNKEALFGLYDQAISGKDPSLHEPFFNAIEAQLGGIDAGEEYMEYKGYGGKKEAILPGTEIDQSLGLLQEQAFPDQQQIASELYQRMVPAEDILSPFESNITRDLDFYIDDEFGQFLKEEELEDKAKRIEMERTLKLIEGSD